MKIQKGSSVPFLGASCVAGWCDSVVSCTNSRRGCCGPPSPTSRASRAARRSQTSSGQWPRSVATQWSVGWIFASIGTEPTSRASVRDDAAPSSARTTGATASGTRSTRASACCASSGGCTLYRPWSPSSRSVTPQQHRRRFSFFLSFFEYLFNRKEDVFFSRERERDLLSRLVFFSLGKRRRYHASLYRLRRRSAV